LATKRCAEQHIGSNVLMTAAFPFLVGTLEDFNSSLGGMMARFCRYMIFPHPNITAPVSHMPDGGVLYMSSSPTHTLFFDEAFLFD
jgi:hypothetical protein